MLKDREAEGKTSGDTASAKDDPWNIQFISNGDREVHDRVMDNGQDRILEMQTKEEITKYGGRVEVNGGYEGNKITIRYTLDIVGVTQREEEEVGVLRRV